MILDPLARKIIDGEISEGDTIRAGLEGDGITIAAV
jgi:hypothetical protein